MYNQPMHRPFQEKPPLSKRDPGSETQSFTNYDEIPYPGLSHAETHPDRLASMATLLGLEPTPVERCRVGPPTMPSGKSCSGWAGCSTIC